VSLTLTLNFYSEILNRNPSTGVPREATATLTNNTKTKDVVWKGPQGWGLNINDLTANGISIYPNPAKNKTNIIIELFIFLAPTMSSRIMMLSSLIIIFLLSLIIYFSLKNN
jgi:hypothetical protein